MEGFHDGELVVQQRAELTAEAARLRGMLGAPHIQGAMSSFAADRDLVLITSRDRQGRLWTSALFGAPGFCTARGASVRVRGRPLPGDPLQDLQQGAPTGLLLVDFEKRRRLRINGTLGLVDDGQFEVAVDQAFGNCPRYIPRQRLEVKVEPTHSRITVTHHDRLDSGHVDQVTGADTFILGTAHPTRGADASHRGGTSGFVRVDRGALWWPDYPGNNLFNSMGNIDSSPATALLFLDARGGTSLQLSGTAQLEWTPRGIPGDDAGTGRRVRFVPEQVVRTTGLPIRLSEHHASGQNPALT